MPFLDANGLQHVAEIIKSNYAGKNSDGAVVSVGADYAEYADWNDGNAENENRTGYFVTVVTGTNQIEIANSDSAIIGVTTDSAGFIGNYSAGAETNNAKGLVGIVGQISVIDNGNCAVGERCMPADDGTAIPSDNTCGYKVIERIDDTHVRIMVSPTIDMIQRIKTDVSELQNSKFPIFGGIRITANSDLNDYTEPGIYVCSTNADAKTISNCPIARAFVMIVYGIDHNYPVQEITRHSAGSSSTEGSKWIRHYDYYLNQWDGWACHGGIDSIVQEGTSGNWRYLKWANGTCMLCYHAGTKDYNCNISSNGLYTSQAYEVATPFPVWDDAVAYSSWQGTSFSVFRNGNSKFRYWCQRPTQGTTQCDVYFVSIGRWK